MTVLLLAIMAKAPRLGTVKTRLAGVLDEAGRLRLYRAFFLDKLDQARQVLGVRVVVAFAPADAEAEMADLTERLVQLRPQRGDGLGERLALLTQEACVKGHPIIIIDSDTPTLPLALLQEAAHKMLDADVDLVLGPAEDGGYYLIGQKAFNPSLFAGIEWSTASVLRQTLEAAANLGLRVHQLEPWYDIDTPTDLDRLRTELATLSPTRADFPKRTAALLLGQNLDPSTSSRIP